jgi:hypothetical protein
VEIRNPFTTKDTKVRHKGHEGKMGRRGEREKGRGVREEKA